MHQIEVIFYAACIAFVLVDFLKIKDWAPLLNRKPFKCNICMGGWVAAVLNGTNFLYTIPLMCASMVFAYILSQSIKRL